MSAAAIAGFVFLAVAVLCLATPTTGPRMWAAVVFAVLTILVVTIGGFGFHVGHG